MRLSVPARSALALEGSVSGAIGKLLVSWSRVKVVPIGTVMPPMGVPALKVVMSSWEICEYPKFRCNFWVIFHLANKAKAVSSAPNSVSRTNQKNLNIHPCQVTGLDSNQINLSNP